MSLHDDVEIVWKNNQTAIENKIQLWIVRINNNAAIVRAMRNKFRVPSGLMAYMNATNAMATGNSLTFSLRYHGQEIAKMIVDRQSTGIKVIPSSNNNRFFKGYSSTKMPSSFKWRSKQGNNFRKFFEAPQLIRKLRSPEHELESNLIRQIKDRKLSSIGGVKLIELGEIVPFQFPLPVSAHKGKPEYSKGNVDILARHGRGHGVYLSVWELKRYGEFKEAVRQVYIYSMVIRKMMQSSSGAAWCKLLKISNPNRTIKSKVVVSSNMKDVFEQAMKDLLKTDAKYIGKNKEVDIEPLFFELTYQFNKQRR